MIAEAVIAAARAGAMARVAVAKAAGGRVVPGAVRAAVPAVRVAPVLDSVPLAALAAAVARVVPEDLVAARVVPADPVAARVVPAVGLVAARVVPAAGPVAAAGVGAVAASASSASRSATAVRARRCPRVAPAGW
jgi:hypothetical protein